jgi:DeoR/GlpR family transcriptional regulator of sugar metabolism
MHRRQLSILEILSRNTESSVRELATQLAVTPMTVRRDLDELQKQGRVVRTHGSATLAGNGVVEFSFAEKSRQNAERKRSIARAALQLIAPGMTISLDTGTTCLEVARAIGNRRGVSILTSSLAIASVLYSRDEMQVILLGGTLRPHSPDLSGPLTERILRDFRVDMALIGCDGITPDGASTTDLSVVRVSQAMMSGASKVIMLADSSKLGTAALYKFADWGNISRLITDDLAPIQHRQWLEQKTSVTYASL